MAVVGLAVAVGLATWLLTHDDSEPPVAEERVETRLVTHQEVANSAALSGHAVYWAGPMSGKVLELTESSDGNVQLRYLRVAATGAEQGRALTIGTYLLPDAARAIRGLARRPGSVARRFRDGRLVVVSRRSPSSAYFASPDGRVQVEVYDPSPRQALALALSGRVRPAR